MTILISTTILKFQVKNMKTQCSLMNMAKKSLLLKLKPKNN